MRLRPQNATTASPGTESHFFLDALQPIPSYPFGPNLSPTHTIEGWVKYFHPSNPDTLFALSECDLLVKLECQEPENLNLTELEDILAGLVNVPPLSVGDPINLDALTDCIDQMHFTSNGTTANFSDITDLYAVWADMSQGNGYSSHYFLAKVRRNSGLIDTIMGTFCKPMKNCEDCDNGCNPDTLQLRFSVPNITAAGTLGIVLPGGDCFTLLPSSISVTGAGHVAQIQTWMTDIETNAPYITATYNSIDDSIYLEIDSDYLGADCQCNSNQGVLAPYNLDRFKILV